MTLVLLATKEAKAWLALAPVDFTVLTGELTPTLKVKRNVVAARFAGEIDSLYNKRSGAPSQSL